MLDRTTPPPISRFGHLTLPHPTLSTLSNNLPLTVIENGADEICRLSLIWERGGAEAMTMHHGAITALMMREGAGSRSAAEVADTLEFNGAQLRIDVGAHTSRLELTATNSRLPHVLPAIVDIITAPQFPAHELGVVLENRARALEIERHKVGYHSRHAINAMMMGDNHPLAAEATPEAIRAVTRDEIVGTWQTLFACGTPATFLAGNVTPAIVDAVDRTIGAMSISPAPGRQNIMPFTPAAPGTRVIERPGALQSAVRIALPAIPREHPDYIPLRILVTALGGYFGSRLMLNIREDKGYTYGIQSNLLGYREGSMTMIGSECDNRYTRALIDETFGELDRLSSGDFTDAEIERVRSYVMSQLAAVSDTPFSICSYYENMILANVPADYHEQQQQALQAITPDSLARLADAYLRPSDARIAIAGDMKS